MNDRRSKTSRLLEPSRLLSRDLHSRNKTDVRRLLNSQASRIEYSFRTVETVRRLKIIAQTIILYVIRGAVRSID